MPLWIDPDWEYYVPNSEIEELMRSRSARGFEGINDDRQIKTESLGFRFGRGNPNHCKFILKREKPTPERREPHEMSCQWCELVFRTLRKGRRVCSNECRYRLLHAENSVDREPIACYCGHLFIPRRQGQKYCSADCWNEAQGWYGRSLTAAQKGGCRHCGQKIPPSRSRNQKNVRIYCSKKCKRNAINREYRQRKADHARLATS